MSLKELEDRKETLNMKAENELNLLNSQIISTVEDLNRLKQVEEEKQWQNDASATENLQDKKTETGNRPNDEDLEQDFRMACATYEKTLSIHNQDNAMAHQQISLFNIMSKDERSTLLIYNTETETKQEKIIQTLETLDNSTCIAQLSSGKLFCYGNHTHSGIALIIDESDGVQELPPGTPCAFSSAIYFNDNVYCFGGVNNGSYLALSSRFDLDRNEWVNLAPLPNADVGCSSIIFNGNILISGYKNINLMRYSIGSNSFTTFPYHFAGYKSKILINGERLYLVECGGSMYESESGSDNAWRRIADSIISFNPSQIYCSYNKGNAYIGCRDVGGICYFKFNLTDKSFTILD